MNAIATNSSPTHMDGLVESATLYVRASVIDGCVIEDPEDASVPGLYAHTVHFQPPVPAHDLLDPKSCIAAAVATEVLDCFHEHQGIEELDPFEFGVFVCEEVRLVERDDDELDSDPMSKAFDRVANVSHDGKVADSVLAMPEAAGLRLTVQWPTDGSLLASLHAMDAESLLVMTASAAENSGDPEAEAKTLRAIVSAASGDRPDAPGLAAGHHQGIPALLKSSPEVRAIVENAGYDWLLPQADAQMVPWLLSTFEAHGRDDDPDHEVGDLQDLVRILWSIYPENTGEREVLRAKVLTDQRVLRELSEDRIGAGFDYSLDLAGHSLDLDESASAARAAFLHRHAPQAGARQVATLAGDAAPASPSRWLLDRAAYNGAILALHAKGVVEAQGDLHTQHPLKRHTPGSAQ